MIEIQDKTLLISFPTPEAAQAFAQFLTTLVNLPAPAISDLPSDQSPIQARSQHTVLTDERLEALSRQREQGLTSHQRQLRAHTMLRDGVLPFSKPGETPAPSGQPSPRMRAQQEGTFADGSGDLPEAERRQRSRLKPAVSKKSSGI